MRRIRTPKHLLDKARIEAIAETNRRYQEKDRETARRFLMELLERPLWGGRVFRSNAELAAAIPNAYRPFPRRGDEEKKE